MEMNLYHRIYKIKATSQQLPAFRQSWPRLVWLSGLSADLRTNGWPVQFAVRVYAWVAGQVPSGGGA